MASSQGKGGSRAADQAALPFVDVAPLLVISPSESGRAKTEPTKKGSPAKVGPSEVAPMKVDPPKAVRVLHPFVALAEKELDRLFAAFPLPKRPVIHWKPYRVSAGMAYYRAGVIGLSKTVLKDEAAVIETLGHEYAHLLAVARHGQKAANHGPHWQKAMIDLGLEPKVRHNFDVERNVARQRVIYKCLRCGADIVRTRRLPKKRRYLHANCGGDIRLHAIEGTA